MVLMEHLLEDTEYSAQRLIEAAKHAYEAQDMETLYSLADALLSAYSAMIIKFPGRF